MDDREKIEDWLREKEAIQWQKSEADNSFYREDESEAQAVIDFIEDLRGFLDELFPPAGPEAQGD